MIFFLGAAEYSTAHDPAPDYDTNDAAATRPTTAQHTPTTRHASSTNASTANHNAEFAPATESAFPAECHAASPVCTKYARVRGSALSAAAANEPVIV